MSGIFTGDIAISSLKVGSSDIAKVMLGGDEVWSSVPDAMVVEGAGTTAVNGLYPRDGEQNGKPRYTLVGGVSELDSILWFGSEQKWTILGDAYESAEDVATPDLVQQWDILEGSLPPPTVRRATAEDF